jgi:CubicO group peptidase (beta-lactamase class C family)
LGNIGYGWTRPWLRDIGNGWATRWLPPLILAGAAASLIIGGVCGWALLSTESSTLARVLVWGEPDVGDQDKFPARTITADEHASRLPGGDSLNLHAPSGGAGLPLDRLLAVTATHSFVVLHKDRIVYERYLDGSGRSALEPSFSIAKSFLSTLVGIAIDEHRIGDVNDPITDYLPELADRDPRFERISLRDLLTMTSGLRFTRSDFPGPLDLPLPWSDAAYAYYGIDLREVALERSEVEAPPGQDWQYNGYNALLLGLVLERATGMSVSDYMATRLWQPLGAESDATWSLDSEGSGFEKMAGGLNATARDYARFGELFLHDGRWNGERVVSEEWVRAAIAAQASTDDGGFGYFWWVDPKRPGNFYAFGDFGQYIYVSPKTESVIVRTGSDAGIDRPRWLEVVRSITDQLTDSHQSD